MANRKVGVDKAVLLVGSALIAVSIFMPWSKVTMSSSASVDPAYFAHHPLVSAGGIDNSMFGMLPGIFYFLPMILLMVCAWGVISTLKGVESKLSSGTLRVGVMAVFIETVAYTKIFSMDGRFGSELFWVDRTGIPETGAFLAFGVSLGLIGWGLFAHWSSGRIPAVPDGPVSATRSGTAAAAAAAAPVPATPLPAFGSPRHGSPPAAPTTTSPPLQAALPTLPPLPALPTLPIMPAPPMAVVTQSPAGWYPDSFDPTIQRYFDGTDWTTHTSPR